MYPQLLDHDPTNSTHDREGVRQFTIALRTAFPDVLCTVNDIVAEGDKVAARFPLWGTHRGEFMGVPATGRRIEMSGIDIVRFEAGKAAEHWGEFDQVGMFQQLGVVPPLA